jgi:hypothetical protein
MRFLTILLREVLVVGFWLHGTGGGSCRASAHSAMQCCNLCIGSGGGFYIVILDNSDKIACVAVDRLL